MVRKFFVGGNWKANGTTEKIKTLCESWKSTTKDGSTLDTGSVEVMIAAPMLYVTMTKDLLPKGFQVAAQNSWTGKGGAFTGETPAEMLKDLGVDWVVLGHSERRHAEFGSEDEEVVARKVEYAISVGLNVCLCIGELLEEREADKTMEVCIKQMKSVKDKLSKDSWDKIVVAYEPVWAIGTGKVATPDQAQEVHDQLRGWMKKEIGDDVADKMRIIYGGSVKPSNAEELSKKADIDGFLVGGASLKPDFIDIIETYKTGGSA